MCAGMMPILHFPGEMMPGQLGPISRVAGSVQKRARPHHIGGGNAFCDADHQCYPASTASMMASAANGGGTKITDAFAPVCFHRFGDVC